MTLNEAQNNLLKLLDNDGPLTTRQVAERVKRDLTSGTAATGTAGGERFNRAGCACG